MLHGSSVRFETRRSWKNERKLMPTGAAVLEYRLAASSDALCIGVLATQVFLDTYATDGIRPDLAREVLAGYSPEVFAARLSAAATTFVVAEVAGSLAGFAEINRESPCPVDAVATRVELVRLYVQRPFQRNGVGTALLARAERHASEAGARAIWLAAWSGNQPALAFYRAARYGEVGRVAHVIEGRTYENRVFVKSLKGKPGK